MDFISVNNQVVSMRGCVKQAKVYVIRRLARSVEHLRKKKGNEEQMSKNNRKADRLVADIAIIKELNQDNISKFCLMNEDKFSAGTKDLSMDNEHRCLLRLAEHKAVSAAVDKFRKQFQKWKTELPLLFKMAEVRKKFKQQTSRSGKGTSFRKRESANFVKARIPNLVRNKVLNSDTGTNEEDSGDTIEKEKIPNLTETEAIDEDDDNCSDDMPEMPKTPTLNEIEDAFEDNDDITTNKDSENESKIVTPAIERIPVKKTLSKLPLRPKLKRPIQQSQVNLITSYTDDMRPNENMLIPTRRIGVMEVRRLKLSEAHEELNDVEDTVDIADQCDDRPLSPHIKKPKKDSFFICENDDSSADSDVPDVLEDSKVHDEDMEDKPNFPSQLDSMFITSLNSSTHHEFSREKAFNSRSFKQSNNYHTEFDNTSRRPFQSSRGQRQQRSVQGRGLQHHEYQTNRPGSHLLQQSEEYPLYRNEKIGIQNELVQSEPSSSLHPSWNAKKKLREQTHIQEFHGKIIKFDD